MYRYVFILFFLCFVLSSSAQQKLQGRVVDEQTNEPLEFVSVYLNTTTQGTRTNEKGEFVLNIGTGTYEVVVSYVGYEPIILQVNAAELAPSYLFKLSPRAYSLSEVEVTAQRDEEWYYNLEVFKKHFLGQSKLAQQSKLLNPEVLIIVYDAKTNVLDVQAKDVLLIENPALGYTIEYLLTDFKVYFNEKHTYFLGYPKYTLMSGGKSKQRRWQKNRHLAFSGSFMHFVRALQQQQLEEQGFNLRRLYRLPNPNRPTDEEIAAARAELQRQSQLQGGSVKLNDTLSDVLNRARLPKVIEHLDKNPVPYTDFLFTEGETIKMAFNDFMQVVYTKEKEEPAYLQQFSFRKAQQPGFQTSVISLRDNSVELEKNGSVTDPLGVLQEGYWGWEKVGEMLPLDYNL